MLDFYHALSRALNSSEMARKCARVAEDLSRGEGARQEYGAEAALIIENKARRDAAVRNKSLAVGLLSFVTLRSGRGLSSWTRKAIANHRAYQFEKAPGWSAASAKAVNVQQPSALRRSLWLALDVGVSASLALLSGAFLFVPRPASYVEDMALLPLVEGKSVYAEVVCPPLLREYRRVLEKYSGRWPVGGNLTQEDTSLNVIRGFVENCTKRSKYERALLEERCALNLGHNPPSSAISRLMSGIARRNEASSCEAAKLGTVSVPSPGVPANVPVDLDQDVFSLDVGDGEGGGENGANDNI